MRNNLDNHVCSICSRPYFQRADMNKCMESHTLVDAMDKVAENVEDLKEAVVKEVKTTVAKVKTKAKKVVKKKVISVDEQRAKAKAKAKAKPAIKKEG